MRLCCEVDNPSDVILIKDKLYQFTVTDIALDKFIVRVVFYLFKVVRIACVGEQVKIDDLIFWVFLYKVGDKVTADKSGTACD